MSLLLFSSQEIYSRLTIEFRQVFLAMEVFQAKMSHSYLKITILVAGGLTKTKNGRVGKCKTTPK